MKCKLIIKKSLVLTHLKGLMKIGLEQIKQKDFIVQTKKSLGCFAILKKSAPVSPKPRANIINAKAKGKNISVTILILFLIYH